MKHGWRRSSSLSHKVTFVEKPKRPYPPPGQDPPPTPGCFGNQRSHKSEDPRRKQNPGNNSANRSNVDVGNADPIKQHPYRLNPSKQKYLKEEIKYLLENNFIEPGNSCWSSPCILVPKPGGSYRMCTDYRKVNSVTKTDTFPISRMDDCIDKVEKLNLWWSLTFSKDSGKFHWQTVPRRFQLLSHQMVYTIIKLCLLEWKIRQPLSSVLSTKSLQILRVVKPTSVMLIIYSDTWEEHLRIIQEFFERLSRAMLTINPLVFIHKMKDKNQRLFWWSLMLQEYGLEIKHIKGKDNVIADCLSRLWVCCKKVLQTFFSWRGRVRTFRQMIQWYK